MIAEGILSGEEMNEIQNRNRAAFKLLLRAAQAISDGELDLARRLQRHAARRLSPWTGGRLAALEAWRVRLGLGVRLGLD
jgi:hypothetical protein